MLLWAVVWFRRISSRHQCYRTDIRTDIRLSARVIPIVVYKKLWNAIDPVLGEIRNKRFQRRRKKRETIDKTQISQREADVPFRVVGVHVISFSRLSHTMCASTLRILCRITGTNSFCLQFRLK